MIKFIFICVLIYFLLKFSAPYLLRGLVKFLFNKQIKNAARHQAFHTEQQPKRKEGSINIDFVPEKKQGKEFTEGEYVDYEEVK